MTPCSGGWSRAEVSLAGVVASRAIWTRLSNSSFQAPVRRAP